MAKTGYRFNPETLSYDRIHVSVKKKLWSLVVKFFIFRILETDDEHFYNPDYGYHWAYSGFRLPDDVLRKIYYGNAARLLHLD